MPHLLNYALQADRWGALPEAGGLRDQPAGMLDKMATLRNIWNLWQAYHNSPSPAEWAGNNPHLWDKLASIKQVYREWQEAS